MNGIIPSFDPTTIGNTVTAHTPSAPSSNQSPIPHAINTLETKDDSNPLPSSMGRKLRELVGKIYNLLMTIRYGRSDSVKVPTQWPQQYQNSVQGFAEAMSSIEKQGCLSANANKIHLEAVERKYPEFAFVSPFIFGSKVELPNQNDPKINKKSMLAIPVVIAANPKLPLDRNHIVTFLVDFTQNRIEFYDSKGLSIEDRKGQELFHAKIGSGTDLSAFLKEIQAKYPNMTIIENTTVHQHDFSNCGVYVATFLEARASGQLFNAPTTREAFTTARAKMLATIADNPPR